MDHCLVLTGEVHKTRRCRGVTYPESYITKCTTYTKNKADAERWGLQMNWDATAGYYEGRHNATWKSEFKLPWREAGPPNHHDDKVDSDQ